MIKLGVLPVRSLLVTEDTLWAASGGQVFVIGVETLGVQVSGWACCAGGAGASSPGPGSPERRRLGLVPRTRPVASGEFLPDLARGDGSAVRSPPWSCGRGTCGLRCCRRP